MTQTGTVKGSKYNRALRNLAYAKRQLEALDNPDTLLDVSGWKGVDHDPSKPQHFARIGEANVAPSPGLIGRCIFCGEFMQAKCGQFVAWHWAHLPNDDPWSERRTDWHIMWQRRFPEFTREVPMGPHRADIRHSDGTVLELQHSGISPTEIREREAFYGPDMIWIFDVRQAYTSGRLNLRTNARKHAMYRSFRWKHPRKTVQACNADVFLDIGDDRLFNLMWMGGKAPYGGWGWLFTVKDFMQQFTKDLDESAVVPVNVAPARRGT